MRKPFIKVLFLTLIVSWVWGIESACFAIPNITNDEIISLTDTTAVITWSTTNETSDTKVHYGLAEPTTIFSSVESVNYHYAVLTGLYPGTTYIYFVNSGTTEGSQKSFTTLTPPTGQYLFTFATLSDPQYAPGKADTFGARGRPYSSSEAILIDTIKSINGFDPSFTILKGDIVESIGGAYGEYVYNLPMHLGGSVAIKDEFDLLGHAPDISSKYFPIPGNHDKDTNAYLPSHNWYQDNLDRLYSLSIDYTKDSIYNYSFDYKGYRFIMLDSVKSDLSAAVNLGYLTQEVTSAESLGLKCFIFLHHPATDLRAENIPDNVLKEISGGTTTDYSRISITNSAEVQSFITLHMNSIAGVFSGHIHDNHYSEISGVPYVRTSSGLQYPAGFNIYKVYTNGYMQTFYKIPYWTEIARKAVTPEAGYSDAYWEQFALGPTSARNFTHTLSTAKPEISSTTPASGETNIPANESITIRFTKPMSQTETQNAVTIFPAISGSTDSWIASDTLVISHSSSFVSGTYTVSISGAAKDLSGNYLTATAFSFATNASIDTVPPRAKFDQFPLDITNNNQPLFTGIATDELSAIVSIECRIDGGSFMPASPSDKTFNSKTESFYFVAPAPLTRGFTPHLIEVRCTDAANNINTTFESYSFYVIGEKPEIGLTSRGQEIISGDPTDAMPSFEVTVISNKGLLTHPLLAIIDKGTAEALAKTLVTPSLIQSIFTPLLTDGVHNISVMIADDSGNMSTREVVGIVVQSNTDPTIQGTTLTYPNPYNGTGNVALSYTLSKNANITITIHDLMGNQLVRKTYASSSAGGKAGYNEIVWNGKTDAGEELGTGIYVYLIIANGNVVGKGKLTVAR